MHAQIYNIFKYTKCACLIMNVVVLNSVLYGQNLREVDRRRLDGSVEAQNRFFTFN